MRKIMQYTGEVMAYASDKLDDGDLIKAQVTVTLIGDNADSRDGLLTITDIDGKEQTFGSWNYFTQFGFRVYQYTDTDGNKDSYGFRRSEFGRYIIEKWMYHRYGSLRVYYDKSNKAQGVKFLTA